MTDRDRPALGRSHLDRSARSNVSRLFVHVMQVIMQRSAAKLASTCVKPCIHVRALPPRPFYTPRFRVVAGSGKFKLGVEEHVIKDIEDIKGAVFVNILLTSLSIYIMLIGAMRH